jgi:hypothetical protein
VNSRRIAGMIGKGDAAIPSAMAAISGVTLRRPCSQTAPSDRWVIQSPAMLPLPDCRLQRTVSQHGVRRGNSANIVRHRRGNRLTRHYAQGERFVSRAAIRSVSARTPNGLKSWLLDLGSNQGPGHQQSPVELRRLSCLGHIPLRNLRDFVVRKASFALVSLAIAERISAMFPSPAAPRSPVRARQV